MKSAACLEVKETIRTKHRHDEWMNEWVRVCARACVYAYTYESVCMCMYM